MQHLKSERVSKSSSNIDSENLWMAIISKKYLETLQSLHVIIVFSRGQNIITSCCSRQNIVRNEKYILESG